MKPLEQLLDTLRTKKIRLLPKENSIFEAINFDNSGEHVFEICSQIANKLNNELVLIKSKLLPFMRSIEEAINDKIDASSLVKSKPEHDIKQIVFPDVVYTIGGKNFLTQHRQPEMLLGGVIIPPQENIESWFVSKDKDIEDGMQLIKKDMGHDDYVELWDKYLNNITETNRNILMLVPDIRLKLDTILLIFVALRNLLEKTPEGLTVPITKFIEVVTAYYNEICNLISIAKWTFEADRKTETLVLGKQDKVLFVDNVLYNQFISEHSPDVLLGYLISNINTSSSRTMQNIVNNKQEYLNTWEKSLQVSNYTKTHNIIQVHKDIYSVVLYNIYTKNFIPEDLKYLIEEYGNNHEEAQDVLRSILNNNAGDYLLNVPLMARDIVGKCMFPGTNFHPFVTSMLSYQNIFEVESDGISPESAASFASVDWLIEYLLEQIIIVDEKGNVFKDRNARYKVL